MKKYWKFLNTPLISAIIAGFILLYIGHLIEKRDRKSDSNILRIENLSNSVESLKKIIKDAKKYLHEHEVPVEKLTEDKKEWRTLLDVSWGKKNDRYNVKTYASFMNEKVPFYIQVNSVSIEKAQLSILNEDFSPVKSGVLEKGENYTFDYNDNKFRVNLLDVRGAGFFRSLAAYFTIEVLIDG